MNVMITGCAKHSKEIVDCLKLNEDGRKVRVIAVDMDKNKILRHGTDAQYVVPPVSSENYIPDLADICKKEQVDIIIPYITAELEVMAYNRDFFSRLGTKVSVADVETVGILNDKIRMYEKFGRYMPEQRVVESLVDVKETLEEMGYPEKKLCCKISGRAGGTGFAILDEKRAYDVSLFNRVGVNRYIGSDELVKVAAVSDTRIILQEYREGLDYSVCVLADHGKVIAMCGYAGYDMVYGAVTNGKILRNGAAYKIAREITEETGLDGNACFDFILENGDEDGAPVLLECNPRINASLGFVWKAGLNMPYLRCKQLMGENIEKGIPNIRYGLRMQKYYEAEYYV